MLVLSRKQDEEVLVIRNGELVCTVRLVRILDHKGNCRLGFEAPDDVKILRREVADRPVFLGVTK